MPTQNSQLVSSRFGGGWLRSGSFGMPARIRARFSATVSDTTLRLPTAGSRTTSPFRSGLELALDRGDPAQLVEADREMPVRRRQGGRAVGLGPMAESAQFGVGGQRPWPVPDGALLQQLLDHGGRADHARRPGPEPLGLQQDGHHGAVAG